MALPSRRVRLSGVVPCLAATALTASTWSARRNLMPEPHVIAGWVLLGHEVPESGEHESEAGPEDDAAPFAGHLVGHGRGDTLEHDDAADECHSGSHMHEARGDLHENSNVHVTIMGVIHEILPTGALQCNCSVFGDESTREAIVIDPGDGTDLARLQAILDKHALTVKAIIITHAHIDHIGAAAKLKASTGAPVYMNSNDQTLYDHLDMQAQWLQMRVPAQTEIDVDARDGATLTCGERR